MAGLRATAWNANYYDARGADASYTQNQVTGNGVSTTLSNSLPWTQFARTIYGLGQSAILLGPNFFTLPNTTAQANTLLHEVLHAYTGGWSDNEIFGAFADYGLKRINPGSGDISNWLETDYQTTPKTP